MNDPKSAEKNPETREQQDRRWKAQASLIRGLMPLLPGPSFPDDEEDVPAVVHETLPHLPHPAQDDGGDE